MKSVSPTCFKIVARTHTRVPCLFPGQRVIHYEKVELSKTLENIVKLERPSFFEVVARPLVVGSILFSNSDFSSMGGSRKGV